VHHIIMLPIVSYRKYGEQSLDRRAEKI